MGELMFAVAFCATPLLLCPIVLRRFPTASRSSAFTLFAVPLVGAATYCLIPPRLGVAAVIVAYPIALVSLGFWAALLAAAGTALLARIGLPARTRIVTTVLAAAASGALVGAGFMLLYAGLDMADAQRFGTAGLVSGAVGGAFAGYDLRAHREALAA